MGLVDAMDRVVDAIQADGRDLSGDERAERRRVAQAFVGARPVMHSADVIDCDCAGCTATVYYRAAEAAAAAGDTVEARYYQGVGDAFYQLHAAHGDRPPLAGLEAER